MKQSEVGLYQVTHNSQVTDSSKTANILKVCYTALYNIRLKALLVNGSLGKILNTKHTVQLPESSILLQAWAKPKHGRNMYEDYKRMPDRTSLTMMLHSLDANTSCWEIALISATDANSQVCLSGASLFSVLCDFPVLLKMPH